MEKANVMKRFEFLEHTADIKIRVYGKTLGGIFENIVLALSSYIAKDVKVRNKIKKKILIESKNNEELVYRFIDELLFLLDAENFIACKSSVKMNLKDGKIECELEGDDTRKYKGLNHVKAATYAEMYVKQLKNKSWEAQFVIDV